MELAGWLLFVVVLFYAGPALVLMPRRTLRRIACRSDEPATWPLVSVVIAARDEEQRIGPAIAGLLASDYSSLEIILANDRSTDRTVEVATASAASDSRLRILTISSVPEGWLGKTNAMSQAAGLAKGEFLLFTDGDVQFAPDTIRLSMRHVLGRKLDHFCLFPSMETEGWVECVLVSFFAMLFSFGTQPWLRAFRFPGAYYGVGAFNLVRRSAYEAAGGHHAIRFDILDDVKLGKLFFNQRASADFLIAEDSVRVRWQTSAWQVIRGLEKNAFASMSYSVTKMAAFSVFYLSVFFSPFAAVFLLPPNEAAGFVASLILLHVTFGRLSAAFSGSWSVLPGLAFGASGVLFAFWRSTWLTLRHGGVTWRDTFYSLKALRAGEYR
ncbi:MAG: glycosyltransferase [Planctomycetota bacterium]|nr:glycosyltransferase [Planctomycetota bacterium]